MMSVSTTALVGSVGFIESVMASILMAVRP
jgi:hypothetical protein